MYEEHHGEVCDLYEFAVWRDCGFPDAVHDFTSDASIGDLLKKVPLPEFISKQRADVSLETVKGEGYDGFDPTYRASYDGQVRQTLGTTDADVRINLGQVRATVDVLLNTKFMQFAASKTYRKWENMETISSMKSDLERGLKKSGNFFLSRENWRIFEEEVLYRVERLQFPGGRYDILYLYGALTERFFKYIREKGRFRDSSALREMLDTQEQFVKLFEPSLKTALDITPGILANLFKEVVKFVLWVVIWAVETAVFAIVDVVLLILECIPYCAPVARIIGIVWQVLQIVIVYALKPLRNVLMAGARFDIPSNQNKIT